MSDCFDSSISCVLNFCFCLLVTCVVYVRMSDVPVMFVNDVLSIAAYIKLPLRTFILNRFLLFHVG